MNKEIAYLFTLQIHRVYLQVSFQGKAYFEWGRNKNTAKTRKPIQVRNNGKFFDVNEKLNSKGNCHLRNGKFKQKQTTIQLWLHREQRKSPISGGLVNLDMSEILSTKDVTRQTSQKYQRKLENCPVPGSIITFTLSARFQSENSIMNNDYSFQGDGFSKNVDMTFRSPDQRFPPVIQKSQPKEKVDRHKSKQRPLQFSFSPMTGNDKNKIPTGNQNLEQLNSQLKHLLDEKSKDLDYYQRENRKLKEKIHQSEDKEHRDSKEKTLSLMNELNSAIAQIDQLKKQKNELAGKYNRVKEQRNQALTNYTKIKEDCQFERGEMSNRFQQRKKQYQEISRKYQNLKRQNDDIKSEVFKKQSQLINLENKSEVRMKDLQGERNQLTIKNERIMKQQSDKLIEFTASLKELKGNYDKLCKERQQLERKVPGYQKTVHKQQETIDLLQRQVKRVQAEVEKQKEIGRKNIQAMETQFREKDTIIEEIQEEFRKISSQKCTITKQKDEQLISLRQKFNSACKKIDEISQKEQSYENKISELKVKISNLETICQNLQKQLEEKEVLLQKAKGYIIVKEEEVNSRQEFIEKARVYLDNKERQLQQHKQRCCFLEKECEELKKCFQQNRVSSDDYKDNRIEDLEKHLEVMQDKLEVTMEQFGEMYRRNKSQQDTLEQLVRKNLDMEIQLNIKNFQLQSAKSTQ